MKAEIPVHTSLEDAVQAWIEDGTWSAPLSADVTRTIADGGEPQRQYRALLLAERLLEERPAEVQGLPWQERWREPSFAELKRGAALVLQRLSLEESEESDGAPVKSTSFSSFWERWQELWRSWRVVMTAALSMAALLFVVWAGQREGWFSSTSGPQADASYSASKGYPPHPCQVTKARLHLSFGVGGAASKQPTVRGVNAMTVQAGSWLYFAATLGEVQGYLSLLQLKSDGSLRIIYPFRQQKPLRRKGPSRVALSFRGTALRYRARAGTNTIGFFAVFTANPPDAKTKKLIQGFRLGSKAKDTTTAARTQEALAQRLSLCRDLVHGFTFQVQR